MQRIMVPRYSLRYAIVKHYLTARKWNDWHHQKLYWRHRRIKMQFSYLHFKQPNILHTSDELSRSIFFMGSITPKTPEMEMSVVEDSNGILMESWRNRDKIVTESWRNLRNHDGIRDPVSPGSQTGSTWTLNTEHILAMIIWVFWK